MAIVFDQRVINPRTFQPGVELFNAITPPIGVRSIEMRIKRTDWVTLPQDEVVIIGRIDISENAGADWRLLFDFDGYGGSDIDRNGLEREFVHFRWTFGNYVTDANTRLRGSVNIFYQLKMETWVTLFD